DRFYIVSEFAQKGSVLDLINNADENITDVLRLRIARDAAAGVAHLHAEGVVHRDISARNFLVAKDYTVMVTDFGMSRMVDSASAESEAARTTSTIGPLRWMAPESLRSREYSQATDSYMFGCFLYELVSYQQPYGNMPVEDV